MPPSVLCALVIRLGLQFGDRNEQQNIFSPTGTVFANQGPGTQNIFQNDAEDRFAAGLHALKNRLFEKAYAKFTEFLTRSPGEDGPAEPAARVLARTAATHLNAAIALLNAAPPSQLAADDAVKVYEHLELAASKGEGTQTQAMARVVLALVIDDYYAPLGAGESDLQLVATLRSAVAELDQQSLQHLVDYLAPVEQSRTWELMAQVGRENLGILVRERSSATAIPDRGWHCEQALMCYFAVAPEPVKALPIAIYGGLVMVTLVGGLIAARLVTFQGTPVGTQLFVPSLAITMWFGIRTIGRAAAYLAYARKLRSLRPLPSEEQLDEWLERDVEYLAHTATLTVRLNNRVRRRQGEGADLVAPQQVIIGVPPAKEVKSAIRRGHWSRRTLPWFTSYGLQTKVGSNGLRASYYDVLVVFMTDRVLSTYWAQFDFILGVLVHEELREHHYTDIVGVSSVWTPMYSAPKEPGSDTPADPDVHKHITRMEEFVLEIANGEPMRVVTNPGTPIKAARDTRAGEQNTRTLTVIQRMIRTRKARI